MALERDRPQTDAGRIDVQPLLGDEEQGVLAGRPQPPQSGEDDALALLEHALQFGEVLGDVSLGRFAGNLVGTGVKVDQQGVLQAARVEGEAPVGRIDGETLVGEGRRDQLGDESPDPGQSHLIVPDDQFSHHP